MIDKHRTVKPPESWKRSYEAMTRRLIDDSLYADPALLARARIFSVVMVVLLLLVTAIILLVVLLDIQPVDSISEIASIGVWALHLLSIILTRAGRLHLALWMGIIGTTAIFYLLALYPDSGGALVLLFVLPATTVYASLLPLRTSIWVLVVQSGLIIVGSIVLTTDRAYLHVPTAFASLFLVAVWVMAQVRDYEREAVKQMVEQRVRSESALASLSGQLQQQMLLMQAILDQSPDAITLLDAEGNHVFISRSLANLYGQDITLLQGVHWRTALGAVMDNASPEAVEPYVLAVESALGGRRAMTEISLPISSGLVHFLISFNPMRDESGDMSGVLILGHEITARKQAEDALRVSEQRYRLLSEAVSTAAYIMLRDPDRTLRIEWASEMVRDVLSPFHGDAAALFDGRAFPSPDTERLVEMLQQAFDDGADFETIATFHLQERDVIARLNGKIDAGDTTRLYLVITDITEQEQIARQRLQIEIEQRQVALFSDFVRAISHDFRTRLSSIELNRYVADSMLKRGDIATARAKLATITNSVSSMTGQIANLHTAASLVRLSYATFDVVELVNGIADTFVERANAKGLTLHQQHQHPQLIIDGDVERIDIAIRHLLENALAHTEHGSIIVMTERIDDAARIGVHDTGIGIPEEHRARIFEMFYRVDEARSAETGGIGLGLSIARMIALAHGGIVEVESEVGVGSSFSILLPVTIGAYRISARSRSDKSGSRRAVGDDPASGDDDPAPSDDEPSPVMQRVPRP